MRFLHDEPKLILQSDLTAKPSVDAEYGFWGCTRQSYDTYYLRSVPKLETGMRFEEQRGDLLFFKTQSPYKTYKDYVGCSGAPILDRDGQLVSLVVEGDKKKTGILGVALHTWPYARRGALPITRVGLRLICSYDY